MKQKILLILLITFQSLLLQAQTWDGSTNTLWNEPTNWSTNTVPGPASSVTIPNTLNKPVLQNNVSLTAITMSTGSALDFNGFTLTTSSTCDINGATLNNSNAGTDIEIFMNGNNGARYFRGTTVNDHIIFTLPSTSEGFYEGYQNPNTFNGNATFNITGTAVFYTSYDNVSTFNGNVTVNRTVAGPTYIFYFGATAVNGNFSYTNNAGGLTQIHEFGTTLVPISGTINITATGAGNPAFTMRRMMNQTGGGTISVQNPGLVTISNDTLIVNALNVNGFTSSGTDDFLRNSITGAVSITDAATNIGEINFRGNTINGNTIFTVNSSAAFYEGYQVPDTFNGSTTFNINGAGNFFTSFDNISTFNGNVTVNRTVAGPTYIFYYGATAVNGNFSYTNNAGGLTQIHEFGTTLVPISGTINITATGAGNPAFTMRRMMNQTGGGTISVQNPGLVTISNDTLIVNALNVNGFTSSGTDDFLRNSITGAVSITDAATNIGEINFRGNTINGNTIFTVNSSAAFYEGYQVPDTFNGSTTFNINGAGSFFTSFDNISTFNGNVTVNRTVAGPTYIFYFGATAVNGNFSYTNNAGGLTQIHEFGTTLVPISGTINITATGAGNPAFTMRRMMNQTGGGTISVQNPGLVTISNDTLIVNALNVNGYLNGGTHEFLRNSITGTVNLSDAATNTGAVYVRGNTINGITSITKNSASILYEAYQQPNTYNGNLNLIRNAGTISFSYDNPSFVNQDLILNSSAGITFTDTVKIQGSVNGIFEQLGTQPILIPKLVMQKTGTGQITLNDSVTISTKLTFVTGNIVASATNKLIFPDNATHSGGSAASHVKGTVQKNGDDAFTFPTGANNSYNFVAMTAPSNVADVFSAEYIKGSPSDYGYDTTLRVASLKKISGCEFWDVKRVKGTSNVSLTLNFAPPCTLAPNYITDPTKLRVAHWTGTIWEDLGVSDPTGTTNGTITTAAPVNNFSPFTFGSVDIVANPLPLRLLSFTAGKCNNNVCLQWKTADEINVSYFEIERSEDGITFEKIKVQSAQNTTIATYNTIDKDVLTGIVYYRLRSVDLDGKFSFSKIVKLDFSKQFTVQISPNPATNRIYIQGAENFKQIEIVDVNGRVIKKLGSSADNYYNVQFLPSGLYWIKLYGAGDVQTHKLIKD
ncbi:MAG: T9SS type A sorting domain-containing protein [Ferruginibacter sp.]